MCRLCAVGTTYPKPSPDDKENDEDEDGRRKSGRAGTRRRR